MEFSDGKYRIQNLSIESIAQDFGTPLYLYDAEKIASQYQRMAQAFSGVKMRIHYAMKALSNLSILKLLKQQGAGLDAVSIEEVQLGIRAGFAPSEIIFTPSCVNFNEIKQAVSLGVRPNLDGISLLKQFGIHYGAAIPCAVRINPHILAGGNAKIQVGHIGSKFGISIFQLPQILEIVAQYGIKVEGLHMHSGSDILDSKVFLRGAKVLFDAAANFPDLKFLDLGSGFKVAYRKTDVVTNLEEVGVQISAAFRAFCQDYGKNLELFFEPGKFLVSEAGIFLATANVVKQTPAALFVGLNSGLNHLIRPMMYDAYHEIVNISNPSGQQKIYDVVGYICETDTFGHNRSLSRVREGDLLAIKNAGAYGMSMSSNYNARLRPAEVLVLDGKAQLIRKRETIADLLSTQIDIF